MIQMIRYNVVVKLRNFSTSFWPFVFPMILATLFYFAFGRMEEADFETVPVAVVREAGMEEAFAEYLKGIEEEESRLIAVEELEEEEALKALDQKEIAGIFYAGEEITLTVTGNGLAESILQSLLSGYENWHRTLTDIMEKHPEGMEEALIQMEEYQNLVEQVSLGGKTTNMNAQFFYALIAMACMYGSFIGFGAAITLQANLSSLAARRCITPTHKLELILSELIACFLQHFMNVLILLLYLRYVLKMDFQGQMGDMLLVCLIGSMMGVSMGIFVGSIGKMSEEIKVGILIGVSMVCSFLAGLMQNSMKNIVDRYVPVINRINPAAVIADAFYCINVYDAPDRYHRDLLTLSLLCTALVIVSFCMVRRECYDSI